MKFIEHFDISRNSPNQCHFYLSSFAA